MGIESEECSAQKWPKALEIVSKWKKEALNRHKLFRLTSRKGDTVNFPKQWQPSKGWEGDMLRDEDDLLQETGIKETISRQQL